MEPTTESAGMSPVRSRLIDTTIDLLAQHGPSAIKARTVATACDLSTMAVYSHFGGIPELVNAVIDEGFSRLASAFAELAITDDPVADLCSMALTTRQQARDNPHLYDLMFGLSMRSTYRPLRCGDAAPSGSSIAFIGAHEHVVAACARLVASGRVGNHDPKAVAGQLWSTVHGFVTLELSDHFAEFDDPVVSVLLRLGINLAVGLGDAHALALASHQTAALALRPEMIL